MPVLVEQDINVELLVKNVSMYIEWRCIWISGRSL